MENKINQEDLDYLYRCIVSIETVEECRSFFDDLCTISEQIALSQRLQVAKLLKEGNVYSQIVADTGASTATISRVNRCLTYGSGGYNKILDRNAVQ